MRFPQTGGSQCGSLRYEITQAPYMIYTCHCTDCQHFTTSAFSIAMLVDAQAFHLTGVEPRAMLHTADSGRNLTRWVCPECGSWMCNGAKPGSANPNSFRAVRGTLDDTSWLRPTVHFWTRSKQPWVVLPDEQSLRNPAGRYLRILQFGGGQGARSDGLTEPPGTCGKEGHRYNARSLVRIEHLVEHGEVARS